MTVGCACNGGKSTRPSTPLEQAAGQPQANQLSEVQAAQRAAAPASGVQHAAHASTTGQTQQFALQLPTGGRPLTYGSKLEADAENVRLAAGRGRVTRI